MTKWRFLDMNLNNMTNGGIDHEYKFYETS